MTEVNEETNVYIITKTPSKVDEKTIKKTKDPKRVEAGRKLAMYNKKAKEDKKKVEEEESFSEQKSYFPSLVQISVVLGIGLTLINIFLGYKPLNPQPKNHFIEKEEKVIEKPKKKATFGME